MPSSWDHPRPNHKGDPGYGGTNRPERIIRRPEWAGGLLQLSSYALRSSVISRLGGSAYIDSQE